MVHSTRRNLRAYNTCRRHITLIQGIIDDCVDAVVFTSQVQVRHLFLLAANLSLAAVLTRALNTRTVTSSVGPTCTATLENWEVMPHVVPQHPAYYAM
jgi:uroporphyrinogen-III synthase